MSEAARLPEDDIEELMDHPIGFTEIALEMPLYPWQDAALAPLEKLLDENRQVRRVKVTVAAPNGSGKSQRVVAAAALYWVSVHKRGRVVITTADGKQLNEQIYPSLTAHRARFPGWKWVTSPNIKITTPTGGTINAFTTDDPGRAEGWHMEFDPKTANFDGPLLIIVDEAKSVPEGIFDALDRCGYNAIMYVSSPGVRAGRFYESHHALRESFVAVQAGLADCPHIPQSKIDDIIATHGANAPFTRSTLYGEFMDSEKAQVFDAEGLARIRHMSGSARSHDGFLTIQPDGQTADLGIGYGAEGWLRWWELPQENRRHLIFADVATGSEQQKGSNDPDRHSVQVFREAFVDQFQVPHNPAIIARIAPPCHSSLTILADRIHAMSVWLNDCLVAVEVNGPGLALIELLKARSVPLYQRTTPVGTNPGSERVHSKPGWLTTSASKPLMIDALATLIREDAIDVWCPHISAELQSFVRHPDGRQAAEEGCHDDDVMGAAGAVVLRGAATLYKTPIAHMFNAREIRERMRRGGRVIANAENT